MTVAEKIAKARGEWSNTFEDRADAIQEAMPSMPLDEWDAQALAQRRANYLTDQLELALVDSMERMAHAGKVLEVAEVLKRASDELDALGVQP